MFLLLGLLTSFEIICSVTQADPLSAVAINKMKNSVAEALDGNAMGYQFSIMQDGEMLLEHAVGYSNKSAGLEMNIKRKIDTGSIAKLITTVTILKLHDDRKIDIYAPFYQYLDNNHFPHHQIHESVKGVTVYDLITHTGQLAISADCPTIDYAGCMKVLEKPRKLENCVNSLALRGKSELHCNRKYQNTGIHILRYIIENVVAGTNTVNKLVDFTHNYWLDEVPELKNGEDFESDYPAMHCANEAKSVRYYVRCGISVKKEDVDSQCLDGVWQEVNTYFYESKFCSSGSWHASASDIVKIVDALANGKILSKNMTSLLFNPGLLDGRFRSSPLMWEPMKLFGSAWNESAIFNKGGSTFFTRTLVYYNEKSKVSMALMINGDAGGSNPITPGVNTDKRIILDNAWKAQFK